MKRYRAVRDKHVAYCDKHGMTRWSQIDKRAIERYGEDLSQRGYSDAKLYLEMNLLAQILKWLVKTEKILPDSHLVVLSLR